MGFLLAAAAALAAVTLADGALGSARAGAPRDGGRFVNTAVKQGSGWLLASVVTIPDPVAAK